MRIISPNLLNNSINWKKASHLVTSHPASNYGQRSVELNQNCKEFKWYLKVNDIYSCYLCIKYCILLRICIEITLLRVAIKPIILCNLTSKLICGWYSIELFCLYSLDLTETVSLLKLPDFEILAFPCNQFLRQDPGTAEQAKDFACTRFKAEYPVFQKVRTVFWTCLLVQKLLLSFLISRWCHGVYMSHGRVHQFGN